MKRYQEGGMPRPDMRPKEEQQADIAEQSEKEAAEREAAAVQRAEDEKMDKKMREARERAKKRPLFNKGGYVRSADGCAKKGKTRGTII
jgi:hypothetical protein